ncbi:hypothetical protein [Shewanella kaireitica]|nr:hypothetical protein [Shewanella kaireitica]MCL1095919.1 hypothetical protein [Shewanella kaireitica]
MKSILNTIDILLGHLAAGIMTFLLYLSLGAIATLFLITIPVGFLEYRSGINDLDLAEIGSLALLCLVVWRFFSRGLSLQWSRWQLVRRFIHAVAINGLIVAFILSFLLVVRLVTKGEVELSSLYKLHEITTFASSLIMIVTIYAAAPLSPFYKDAHDIKLSAEKSASEADSDGTQHTGTDDFAEDLKNFKAPDNPWEKA